MTIQQEINNDPRFQKLVFFDGECLLCNRFLQLLIKKDHRKVLTFSTLQAPKAQEIILHSPKEFHDKDSVLYLHQGKLYAESDAALRIIKELKAPYRWAFYLIIVPRLIRNPIYRLIAKYRKRIMGTQVCMVPSPEIQDRFIF